MIDSILRFLTLIDNFFWSYVGVYAIIIPGIYLTIKSRGFQFKVLYNARSVFRELYKVKFDNDEYGINPFKLYFASIGGMIGLGNIVIVITAVTIGGPGALVWLWVSALFGMLIKYSEIYLGVKYRIPNKKKGYDGGPMFYLQEAFGIKAIPIVSCLLLCIYGVEISQFKIISDTITATFDINPIVMLITLIVLVLYTAVGGVKRVANYSSFLMPIFMISYICMCSWIIFCNYEKLPHVLYEVLRCSVQGHAPLGGFLGSTMIAALHFGVARAVYSGDIAIGYDSIIQSETKTKHPELQAKLAVFGQLTDTIICTFSIMVVLLTGVWTDETLKEPSEFILKALSMHFPYINISMSILFFLAGYTTIIAYLTVGLKSASFISKTWGKRIYILYALGAFTLTHFTEQTDLIMIMSLSGGLLVLLNILGILKLRKKIKFM